MSINPRIKDGILSASLIIADRVHEGVAESCGGEYGKFTSSYAHDIFLPAQLYFMYGALGLFKRNKWANAAFIFLGCSAFEIAQALGWYPGTFDPNDFIAYAAGVGLTLGIDTIASGKKKTLEDKFKEKYNDA